jgi:hypothetical protein
MGFDSRKETSYCAELKLHRNNPTAKLHPWNCKQEIPRNTLAKTALI